MNYPANTIHWKTGDLVIHDYDAKTPDMLMQVQGYDAKTGECITVYQRMIGARRNPTRWKNDIRFLHDPSRFNIVLPAKEPTT